MSRLDAEQRIRREQARLDCGANGRDAEAPVHVLMEPMAERAARNPEWIWKYWLASGKLQILAGSPGTGKTTIALWMAAILSSGSRWLGDDADTPARDVIIWSGEDTLDDVILPRLISMGADLHRIFAVRAVLDGEEIRAFDPARDMPALERILAGRDVGLVILDPIILAITGDAHKSVDVRRGLEAVGAMAEATAASVLGISHFSKGTAGRDPLERVTGSLAFGAVCRLVMGVTEDKESGDFRFCRMKSSNGPSKGGWRYRLHPCEVGERVETVRVEWGEAVEGSASEILGAADANEEVREERSALEDARMFIRSALADGAVPSRTLLVDARDAGHSGPTIQRAMRSLTESRKEGKVWYASLK